MFVTYNYVYVNVLLTMCHVCLPYFMITTHVTGVLNMFNSDLDNVRVELPLLLVNLM